MLSRIALLAAVNTVLVFACVAQDAEPIPAPDDIVLRLETEGNRRQFHVGELIPIEFSYSSENPGKYIWVSGGTRLAGGRALDISCSPPGHRVGPDLPPLDNMSFEKMLYAPCGGVGGGFGSGSPHVSEIPLTKVPLTFGSLALNTYVRFRVAGTYTCQASSAEITSKLPDESIRPALLGTSNPIVLNIVDDLAWAHAAAAEYGDAYSQLCRGDDVVSQRFLECSALARRIMYLDSSDSLAIEVREFDGREHRWDSGFWDAIRRSSQPQEALQLMSSRMQDPDFQVSVGILEWLATAALRLETPDAFERAAPEDYHAQAVEELRKYVRLLGVSLSKKQPAVVRESVATYRRFAEQNYCEQQPLIPQSEEHQVLSSLSR